MVILNWVKKAYLSLHRWLVGEAALTLPVEVFRVHVLLAIVFLTGSFMWSYAFVSFFLINEPSLNLGFLYAAVHVASILAFKKTRSYVLATYFMLVPGGIFQTHFSYFTGGVQSATLVWTSILPLIAGVLIGPFHAKVWAILSALSVTGVFLCQSTMGAMGQGTATGELISRALVLYGMIAMTSGFTIFLIRIALKNEDTLRAKTLEKQGLLRIMVHDIANPITVIRGKTNGIERDILLPTPPVAEIKSKVQSVYRQLDRVDRQIKLVRELEAVSSGKVRISLKSASLQGLVNHAIDALIAQADKKNITLSVSIPEQQTVWANETLLENQILGNLLSNAIKFSHPGGCVSISAQELNGWVRLIVQDQGTGIDPQGLESLFDPLAPSTQEGTQGETGTGFGMPIVKAAVEALSGGVEVNSQKGNGTTVVIHLPANQQALAAKAKRQSFYLNR